MPRQAERKEAQGEVSFWDLLVMLLLHLCPDSERHEQPWMLLSLGRKQSVLLTSAMCYSAALCVCVLCAHTLCMCCVLAVPGEA